MKIWSTFLLITLLPALGFASELKGNWILDKSEIDYKVTHPLHHVIGKSTEARGKGICSATKCQFIVAVPVKSFETGDENRDLHMLQVTKGGDYPLIAVNVEFPMPSGPVPPEILADLVIEFAGQKVNYSKVPLAVVSLEPGQVRVTAVISLSLKAFDITPPSLLGVPIEDSVPIQLDTTWKKVGTSAVN
jgi:hypothetical protein